MRHEIHGGKGMKMKEQIRDDKKILEFKEKMGIVDETAVTEQDFEETCEVSWHQAPGGNQHNGR